MRAAFGILSLLLTIAIVLIAFAGPLGPAGVSYTTAVTDKRQATAEFARQLGGLDPGGGIPVELSLRIEVIDNAPVVTRVIPRGPMYTRYGIAIGDELVSIGYLPARDTSGRPSVPNIRQWIILAYSRNLPITVRRGRQVVELPTPRHKEWSRQHVAPMDEPLAPRKRPAAGAAIGTH